jgi:hypothetical protein
MGGAYTAVSDDINAVYYNPAGLGFFKTSEFAATQFGGYSDFKLSDLSVAIPLGDVTTTNVHQLGTLAFNIANLNYGSIAAVDPAGTPRGNLNASDRVYALGWGRAFTDRLALGALAKFYSMQIFKERAEGSAFNVGLLARLVPGTVNFGLSASNLGANVQFAGRTENPPVEYLAGLSVTPSSQLTLALDGGVAQDRSGLVRAGAEYRLTSAFCLRAGYDSSYDAGPGVSFGAGIQLLNLEVGFFPIDKVGLDYAFTPGDNVDATHRVALVARIGTQ